MMYDGISVLLASKSPRRQQILRECGVPFRLYPLEFHEDIEDHILVSGAARYLAEKKASHVGKLTAGEVLLTADTTVILENRLLGKPHDGHEAHAMLSALSGKMHQVITGVCLATKDRSISFDDTTSVYFRELLDSEIEYYIDHYRPFDKAGAYGIQEWIGLVGIQRIEGSYFNVMGLPIHKVYAALREINRLE